MKTMSNRDYAEVVRLLRVLSGSQCPTGIRGDDVRRQARVLVRKMAKKL